MVEHPLVRDDVHLIQDFMLTKITLLLAHNAAAAEWQFEINAMRRLSDGRWVPRNAFLLHHTLARCLAALESAESSEQPSQPKRPTETEVDGFRRSFTDAVNADQGEALGIWAAWHADKRHAGEAPDDAETTHALYSHLRLLATTRPITAVSELLPGPYGPSDQSTQPLR